MRFIKSFIFLILIFPLNILTSPAMEITDKNPKAGGNLEISGQIEPGKDLYLIISSNRFFKASDSKGSQEKDKLYKMFKDTQIPPVYYILTTAPEKLAAPQVVSKGQWFKPFKWDIEVNKIKKWNEIDENVKANLGKINSQEQWNFLIFTHEDKYGINTVSKEMPIGGGNSRMIMSPDKEKSWNRSVDIELDKETGKYKASFNLSRKIPPDTKLDISVNGKLQETISVQKSGFYFTTGGTYMNPVVVFLGAFIIGTMFVIVGAAGGLFTAAFQITIIGTGGMTGINAANAVKPTNMFLTLCSPITSVWTYFKEGRLAWPVALFFIAGIIIGSFWIGPQYSAKYLPMKAYKFYLGFFCLALFVKLWLESTKKSIEKKQAVNAIVKKFDAEIKAAKEEGRAAKLGQVVLDKHWNLTKLSFSFWGQSFSANPVLLFFGGLLIGCLASAFGVGGGFMLVPFMTTIMGYPMYLAVPISLCGSFATSVGGIAKYAIDGYQPDWIMAALIAAGAILGGKIGPKIQKKLPEIFLKRSLALILFIVFLNYTGAIPFLR
ncbi:MAG: sulfite exporter TauE/SafE family protein [Desulfobacteraceae bacterium]|nr:sulfite exporter TauE/SafE family protein [Desulfobacteraceae bacterium]